MTGTNEMDRFYSDNYEAPWNPASGVFFIIDKRTEEIVYIGRKDPKTGKITHSEKYEPEKPGKMHILDALPFVKRND